MIEVLQIVKDQRLCLTFVKGESKHYSAKFGLPRILGVVCYLLKVDCFRHVLDKFFVLEDERSLFPSRTIFHCRTTPYFLEMNISQQNLSKNNSRLNSLRSRLVMLMFLSVIAGSVDAIGFLGLNGLFTAHITGNLVIVAAHFLTGGFSQIGPLLAVPIFMIALGLTTLASAKIEAAGLSALRALLVLETVLLASFLDLAVAQGPFPNADAPVAVIAGMLGVVAMAVQNALGKLAIKQTPSTAAMTTNVTQLTVDVVTMIRGASAPAEKPQVRHRATATLVCVLGFIAGCVAGAMLQAKFGFRSLILPFVFSVVSTVIGWIE